MGQRQIKRWRRFYGKLVNPQINGFFATLCKDTFRARAFYAWRILIGKPVKIQVNAKGER